MTTANSSEGKIKEVIVDSRINKILSMRTDSVAMLEALDAISEFYVTNSVDARRTLRQDLELQNISLAKKFLTEFDQVRSRIEDVEYLSNNLEAACGTLASRVKEADENMKSFMEKASELENRRNSLMTQSKEIETFLSRFRLSNDEVELLYNGNLDSSDVANKFFDALQRLRSAYNDCRSMVENHFYSVGFELLEVLGQHQDMAYQHLFEWVKLKCDALAETGKAVDDYDTNMKLQTAIRFLKNLPVYFSQCQDLLVSSRRTQLVQKFIVALTQGETSSKVVRAIDLHAHDAVKYVGGMLGWMHQAIASEEEFLESIFGDAQESKSKSKVASEDDSPIGLTVYELLARCLQGLGRPLRSRIAQTIESRSGIEILYSLIDLLSFYEKTFHGILPVENAVHSAVKGCLLECRRMFTASLNKQADMLTQSPVSYPLDLKASHLTRECANQIQEILKAYNRAMSPQPINPQDPCHIDVVLGNIIQPLLQSCRLGGQSLQPNEMATFMLNNVAVIQHEVKEGLPSREAFSSSEWLSLLETEVSTWVDILVAEETAKTLKRSDLDKLLELVEVLPSGLKAIEQVGLSQDRVGTVMRSFYASLFSTVAPQFERLQNPGLRETIRNSTAERVANAHALIHKVVNDESNGYDRSILLHTVDEVKVLLGCESKSK